jgi:hypothetical protein
VNEQIIRHNKQLLKLIKRYKHVTLVKSTINRDHFTRHGLHLNRGGKEVVSKEIINYLPINQSNSKVAVFQLPWKDESGRVGTQPSQTKESSEAKNTAMTKAVEVVNNQYDVNNVNNQCVSSASSYIMDEIIMHTNLMALPGSNEQQGGTLEPDHTPSQDKEKTGCVPKSQRNCPKVRDNDFFFFF